jgi:hypothetical protein
VSATVTASEVTRPYARAVHDNRVFGSCSSLSVRMWRGRKGFLGAAPVWGLLMAPDLGISPPLSASARVSPGDRWRTTLLESIARALLGSSAPHRLRARLGAFSGGACRKGEDIVRQFQERDFELKPEIPEEFPLKLPMPSHGPRQVHRELPPQRERSRISSEACLVKPVTGGCWVVLNEYQ